MYRFQTHASNMTQLEKKEGLELIQGIKLKIHTDPKNKEKYKTILATAETLLRNDKLDIFEISHLDILMTQVILSVKQGEDLIDEDEEDEAVKKEAKIENVNTSAEIRIDNDENQENTNNHTDNGDLSDQTKPEKSQSLYPTLYFSFKEYDTSKLNKDISHLFVPPSPSPSLVSTPKVEEIDPKETLKKNISQFSDKLEAGIKKLENLTIIYQQDKTNWTVLKARLDKVKQLNTVFNKFKEKIDDSNKLQRYENLLIPALLYKPSKDNSKEVTETSVATNKSSLVNNLPKKEISQKVEKKRVMAI